jgi:opacity protein-like surface antigen
MNGRLDRRAPVIARSALVLAASLAASAVAAGDLPSLRGAQPLDAGSGVYVGARGGLTVPSDVSWLTGDHVVSDATSVFGPVTVRTVTTRTGAVTSRFESSGGYSGFLGYDFGTIVPGMGARVEAEVGRFDVQARGHRFTGNQTTTTITTVGGATAVAAATGYTTVVAEGPHAGGTVGVRYGLMNYYVDIDLGRFKPFLGAGVGVAHVDVDGFRFGAAPPLFDAQRWAFAWQVGGGLSFDVLPNLALEIGYRYVGAQDVNLTTNGGAQNRIQLQAQQVNAGVRFRF